mmetsp:Transcript_8157/g.20020  ORF Transcript_8157/g.20020 Transcript_8157/m.20020 type:complete len:338 (-) Transcript_8157:252-1265(-)
MSDSQSRELTRRDWKDQAVYYTKPKELPAEKVCMVLGKVGVGKSTTLNHIISGSPYPKEWNQPFKTSDSVNGVTQCSSFCLHNDILFFDTPGLADPEKVDEFTVQELNGIFKMINDDHMPSMVMVIVKGSRLSEEDQQVLNFVFEKFTGDPSSIILVVTHVDPEETEDSCRKRFSEMKGNDQLKKRLLGCCTIAVMEQQKSPKLAEILKEDRTNQLKRLNGLIKASKANAEPAVKDFSDFFWMLIRAISRAFRKSRKQIDALTKIYANFRNGPDGSLPVILFGECPVCFESVTMKNVAQFHCRHTACETCADTLLRELNPPRCPVPTCKKLLVKLEL